MSSEVVDPGDLFSELSLVDVDTNNVLYLDANQEDIGGPTGTLTPVTPTSFYRPCT